MPRNTAEGTDALIARAAEAILRGQVESAKFRKLLLDFAGACSAAGTHDEATSGIGHRRNEAGSTSADAAQADPAGEHQLGTPFPTAVAAPATVADAVRLLLNFVPEDERPAISQMPHAHVVALHFSVGTWVRNNMGLQEGNFALLADTGARTPDRAATVIVRAFWQSLLSLTR